MAGKADIRAGGAFVELFVKGAKLEQGLRAMSAKVKVFADSLNDLGRRLATFGVAAGTGIGLAAKRFANFDDAMRAAGAAIDATDTELKTLTDSAKGLSAASGIAALDVASLMIELGRAGFVADEVNKMTGAVLNLARATGTDATLASGI